MITHKIKDRTGPMTMVATWPIKRNELYRIRMLLDIQSIEGWEDEKLERLGIVKDSVETIISVAFEDGATLDWQLCCGTGNYYDNVVFQYPDGTYTDLDCSFYLDDIEIDTGSTIYIVKLEIQDE